jgi:hypothetical protein
MAAMKGSHESLTNRLVKHDRFYNRMINLIPKELYLHTKSSSYIPPDVPTDVTDHDDKGGNKKRKNQEIAIAETVDSNGKYFKHRKQPLTADERKLQSQQNKKAKYAAENAILQEEKEHVEPIFDTSTRMEVVDSTPKAELSNDKIEELKKRLQVSITQPAILTAPHQSV